jgi:hypothetical protein
MFFMPISSNFPPSNPSPSYSNKNDEESLKRRLKDGWNLEIVGRQGFVTHKIYSRQVDGHERLYGADLLFTVMAGKSTAHFAEHSFGEGCYDRSNLTKIDSKKPIETKPDSKGRLVLMNAKVEDHRFWEFQMTPLKRRPSQSILNLLDLPPSTTP